MTDDVIQTLASTPTAHPTDDPDEWADRFREAGLLSDRQADVIARKIGTTMTRKEIADDLGISPSAVDQARMHAEEKLLEADETLGVVSDLRREIRPDPYEDQPSDQDEDGP